MSKRIIEIQTISEVRDEEIKRQILIITKEMLDIGVCKYLVGYFSDALRFACKMRERDVREIEGKVINYFKNEMCNKLLQIFQILRRNGYDVVNYEKFVDSIEREVKPFPRDG